MKIDRIEEQGQGMDSEAEALMRTVREHLEKVIQLGKVLSPDILMVLDDISDPGRLADLVASNLGPQSIRRAGASSRRTTRSRA